MYQHLYYSHIRFYCVQYEKVVSYRCCIGVVITIRTTYIPSPICWRSNINEAMSFSQILKDANFVEKEEFKIAHMKKVKEFFFDRRL